MQSLQSMHSARFTARPSRVALDQGPADWQSNGLLAALPAEVLQRWRPRLHALALPAGHVIHELGDAVKHVVFPTNALVSILFCTGCGASNEVAMVGKEGVVGVASFMGGGAGGSRAVVQCAGWGLRLDADLVRKAIEAHSEVRQLLLRYTQALITQVAQTAVCNRHHSVYQQVCRHLLLSLDRLKGTDLALTQEQLAAQLGVRREGVTLAAIRLQGTGVIRYARGRIEVLSRAALERECCECYGVVKAEFDRLLAHRPYGLQGDSRSTQQRPLMSQVLA